MWYEIYIGMHRINSDPGLSVKDKHPIKTCVSRQAVLCIIKQREWLQIQWSKSPSVLPIEKVLGRLDHKDEMKILSPSHLRQFNIITGKIQHGLPNKCPERWADKDKEARKISPKRLGGHKDGPTQMRKAGRGLSWVLCYKYCGVPAPPCVS